MTSHSKQIMKQPPPTLLITGASRGIGAATALLCAARGYRVAVNYHKQQQAAAAIVQNIQSLGGEAMAFAADVSQEQAVKRLFDEAEAAMGPITALVNNAGIVDSRTHVADMSAERLERMFRVNVFSAFYCSAQLVRRVIAHQQAAAIVNISSVASRLGSPNQYVDYAASKAAIDTFTIGLAKEVASQNIRVNAIRPGIIDTEIHASGGEPQRVQAIAHQLPMLRAGQPQEVAEAIFWLLSDASSYVTGSILDVSGGR